MKDSQDWLDEILENLWYEAAHDAEPIGSATSKASISIREHFLKEALSLIDEEKSLMDAVNDYKAELRNKFNDKYKEV